VTCGEAALRQANRLPTLRAYLALSLGLHLLWETVQLIFDERQPR
jgi:hypothetical protein